MTSPGLAMTLLTICWQSWPSTTSNSVTRSAFRICHSLLPITLQSTITNHHFHYIMSCDYPVIVCNSSVNHCYQKPSTKLIITTIKKHLHHHNHDYCQQSRFSVYKQLSSSIIINHQPTITQSWPSLLSGSPFSTTNQPSRIMTHTSSIIDHHPSPTITINWHSALSHCSSPASLSQVILKRYQGSWSKAQHCCVFNAVDFVTKDKYQQVMLESVAAPGWQRHNRRLPETGGPVPGAWRRRSLQLDPRFTMDASVTQIWSHHSWREKCTGHLLHGELTPFVQQPCHAKDDALWSLAEAQPPWSNW